MQKKLSKHFIYNWLEEDAYGEYMLHHSGNKFSNRVLLNLWNFLNDTKRVSRGSLVLGSKSTKSLDFISSALRYTVLSSFYNISSFSKDLISEKKNLKLKNYYYKNLFLYSKNILITRRVQFALKILPNSKRLFFFSRKKIYLNWKNNNNFLNYVKYIWRKSRRIRRTRGVQKLNNLHFFLKNNSTSARTDKVFKSSDFSSKRNFVKRACLKIKQLNPQKNLTISQLKVWRLFSSRKTIKTSYFNLLVSKSYTLLNLKNYILSFSWDSFAYKLKQRVKRIMQTSKAVKKFLLNTAYAKLKFKGTFQKRVMVVKKNETIKILNFRLLNYYNLVVTPGDLNSIYYNMYYKGKFFQLPLLSTLEFNLVPILLRAGFFENGYIANSLSKRNLFLINGCAATANVLVNVWDIISLSKSIWWFVYARYTNFFTVFATSNLLSNNNKNNYKNINFIKQLIKLKNLFKKFDYRKKISTQGKLSKLVYLKNYIFSLPPAYMEVSYKLFMIIVYRVINKSMDLSAPFNRRGLKTILPSFTNRAFS